MKKLVFEPLSKVRKKLLKFFVVVIVAVAIIFYLMFRLVNPIVLSTGEKKIDECTSYAVNLAVNECMKGSISYDDLIYIVTDAMGKITMLQVNSVRINALSRDVIQYSYNYIMEGLSSPISIPLGSFSGIPIFAGLGPSVVLKVVPYGSVKCNFISKFVSAGINQTVHKIYLSISTDVTMVLPYNNISASTSSEVLVCESLILGEIPETYLMAESIGDMLNLVG